MKSSITVIGSSNVDMIMKLERLPEVGETVTEGEFLQTYGGKGANQAIAASRSGAEVSFITSIGNDMFGQALLQNFRKDNINTDNVLFQAGIPTGTALILIDKQGRNCISVAPGANYFLDPEDIKKCSQVIEESGLLIMQMELKSASVEMALKIADRSHTHVLFNFAPVHSLNPALTARMTYLVVNEKEAAALSGLPVISIEDAKIAAEKLHALGPRNVIITLGERGLYLESPTIHKYYPAYHVDAVDTTAAGDAFCGSLGAALIEGALIEEAVSFAQASAALCATRIWAQPSLPYREEILAFQQQKRHLC